MKLSDIPTPELRRYLQAAERLVGRDAMESRIFRRELARRKQRDGQQRKGARK